MEDTQEVIAAHTKAKDIYSISINSITDISRVRHKAATTQGTEEDHQPSLSECPAMTEILVRTTFDGS